MGRVLTSSERNQNDLYAAKEVSQPTPCATLIITIVYIPILNLTGTRGKMFKPMALTAIYALIGALDSIAETLLLDSLRSYFPQGKKVRRGG